MKQRLSRWMVDAITQSYSSLSLYCHIGVRAHSRRGVASSWAWSSGVSIAEICAEAGWASPSTFARFYNLEVPALQARVLFAWKDVNLNRWDRHWAKFGHSTPDLPVAYLCALDSPGCRGSLGPPRDDDPGQVWPLYELSLRPQGLLLLVPWALQCPWQVRCSRPHTIAQRGCTSSLYAS